MSSEDLKKEDKNYFLNYVKSYIVFDNKGRIPKHKYTLELHRCKFNEEILYLSDKFESTVFKRTDVDKKFV